MKKTPLNLLLAGLLASVPPCSVMATDYELTLSGSNQNWATAGWSPAGIPGEGDNVTVGISGSGGTARNLFVDGERTIENFTKISGDGSIILSNGTAGTDSTLTIADTLQATGSFILRSGTSASATDPGRLTVNTEDLVLNSSIMNIGGGSGYSFVTLNVSGTTRIEDADSGVVIGSTTTAQAHINLGDVVFGGGTGSASEAGIRLHGKNVTLTVRSLEGSLPGSSGSIHSSNTDLNSTLLINGNEGTSHNLALRIRGDIKIVKEGSNVQIFSNSNNNYAGGTEIRGGVLGIQGGLTGTRLGTNNVLVANGGTLAGSAAVILSAGKSTTVEAGGNIAPGADGAVGFNTLGFANAASGGGSVAKILDMQDGSSFTFRLDALGGSDKIVFGNYVAGNVLFDNVSLNITGTLAEGITYELFSFQSGALTGNSLIDSGLDSGLVAGTGFDGYLATFHYDEAAFGGTGIISMTVIAVPEPSALILLGLAGVVMMFLRRR